jgi:hypothetical protein
MSNSGLKLFASGMVTLLKVLEDYPDDLRKKIDWDEFTSALISICEGVAEE